jgi:hypothetical protein
MALPSFNLILLVYAMYLQLNRGSKITCFTPETVEKGID